MPRILAALALALFLASPAAAAEPKIETDRTEINFGQIFQGETITRAFAFRNAGDAPLNIEQVKTSCGCTAALLSNSTLAPGESGEVSTTFDSTRFRGAVVKTIYLYSNDPKQRVIQLHLRGTVQELFRIMPEQFAFGPIPPEKSLEGKVTLTNQSGNPIRITAISTTAPEFTARAASMVLSPGQPVDILVTAIAKPGPARVTGYVMVKTDSSLSGEIRIPVYLAVTQP